MYPGSPKSPLFEFKTDLTCMISFHLCFRKNIFSVIPTLTTIHVLYKNIGFFWKHFLRLLGGEVWWIPKCYFFTALKSDNAHIFHISVHTCAHVHPGTINNIT
jgi:hypothetical protein